MHVIRMEHPGKNALGTGLVRWLEGELDRAGDAPVLLTGSGNAFSAGLDLKEVAGHDRAGLEAMLRRLDALLERLFLHPAPTAACVNGHAIAGGCLLMLCCDVRVAAADPKARIGVNEVAIGACVPPRGLRIVRHRLGAATERAVLGAGLHSPADALALGLVDEFAADAEGVARQRLESLAAHPRAAYATTKRALRAPAVATDADDERRFREVELPIWTSPEMQQRLAAFLGRK
jgi:enoyl-CoA hydratase/carnithine racemase